MRPAILCVMVVSLLTLMSGCASSGSHSGNSPSAQFREGEQKLEVGMSKWDVEQLLGKPSQTSVETVGQNSPGGSWNALIWTYRFSGRRLLVYFNGVSEGDPGVNNWRWAEY